MLSSKTSILDANSNRTFYPNLNNQIAEEIDLNNDSELDNDDEKSFKENSENRSKNINHAEKSSYTYCNDISQRHSNFFNTSSHFHIHTNNNDYNLDDKVPLSTIKFAGAFFQKIQQCVPPLSAFDYCDNQECRKNINDILKKVDRSLNDTDKTEQSCRRKEKRDQNFNNYDDIEYFDPFDSIHSLIQESDPVRKKTRTVINQKRLREDDSSNYLESNSSQLSINNGLINRRFSKFSGVEPTKKNNVKNSNESQVSVIFKNDISGSNLPKTCNVDENSNRGEVEVCMSHKSFLSRPSNINVNSPSLMKDSEKVEEENFIKNYQKLATKEDIDSKLVTIQDELNKKIDQIELKLAFLPEIISRINSIEQSLKEFAGAEGIKDNKKIGIIKNNDSESIINENINSANNAASTFGMPNKSTINTLNTTNISESIFPESPKKQFSLQESKSSDKPLFSFSNIGLIMKNENNSTGIIKKSTNSGKDLISTTAPDFSNNFIGITGNSKNFAEKNIGSITTPEASTNSKGFNFTQVNNFACDKKADDQIQKENKPFMNNFNFGNVEKEIGKQFSFPDQAGFSANNFKFASEKMEIPEIVDNNPVAPESNLAKNSETYNCEKKENTNILNSLFNSSNNQRSTTCSNPFQNANSSLANNSFLSSNKDTSSFPLQNNSLASVCSQGNANNLVNNTLNNPASAANPFSTQLNNNSSFNNVNSSSIFNATQMPNVQSNFAKPAAQPPIFSPTQINNPASTGNFNIGNPFGNNSMFKSENGNFVANNSNPQFTNSTNISLGNNNMSSIFGSANASNSVNNNLGFNRGNSNNSSNTGIQSSSGPNLGRPPRKKKY